LSLVQGSILCPPKPSSSDSQTSLYPSAIRAACDGRSAVGRQERAAGYKKKDFIEAKKDFVTEMLKWSGAHSIQPKRILDCGCGIGGTSRLLAKAFPDAQIVGITLSPSQVTEPLHARSRDV
jgi:2-polyprenyl-3-methyl-5-hydroxy-6-metoxy-1,4-benzoquinol methylase